MRAKSLLIIDDDEDIGDALQEFFKKEGYRVNLATSGVKGLELANTDLPGIILLDWQMPRMGGQQVLNELAGAVKLREIPVIVMSANVAEIPVEYLKPGRFIRKPFDVEALIALVARLRTEK